MAKAELVSPKVQEHIVLTLSKDEAWTLAVALLNMTDFEGPCGNILEDIYDGLGVLFLGCVPSYDNTTLQRLPDDFNPNGWSVYEDDED